MLARRPRIPRRTIGAVGSNRPPDMRSCEPDPMTEPQADDSRDRRAPTRVELGRTLAGIGATIATGLGSIGATEHLWGRALFLLGFSVASLLTGAGLYVQAMPVTPRIPHSSRQSRSRRPGPLVVTSPGRHTWHGWQIRTETWALLAAIVLLLATAFLTASSLGSVQIGPHAIEFSQVLVRAGN